MKSIVVVACLLGLSLLGLSGSANATLLGVGENLVYDSDLQAVWYSAPSLLQSTFEDLPLVLGELNASSSTASIEGHQVSLDWQVATMNQVNSLDWFFAETRGLFTPDYYGEPLHPPSWMDTVYPGPWMEYDISGRVDEPAWDPDLTDDVNLGCTFQLYMSPEMFVENWDEPDSMYMPLNSSLQGTWAIATFSSVPEPSTLLLFGCGLAGLLWYRRKMASPQ